MPRRAEQDVLGDAHVREVRVAIEEFDERLETFALHALANPRPRGDRHGGNVGMALRIGGAREAEADHLPLHVDERAARAMRGRRQLGRRR